ncbi:EthD family reductase [Nonomuraea sp. NPDC052116]|uniref:EthD family reductase n=1 Tax=Nonomuraea sp. NPDC052116 TaxID=3155665 RepID=UPI003422CB2D
MIQASLLYPNTEGSHFDFEYWQNSHLPWLTKILSPALQHISGVKGLSGGEPGSRPPYVAIGALQFESLDAMQAAYMPHMEAIFDDIKNFTDITPVLMLGEVVGPR